MKMKWLARALLPVAQKMAERDPDFTITRADEPRPYLRRWFATKRRSAARVYLHEMVGDDDAALHTHPYWSVSLVLSDGLVEKYQESPPDGPIKHREPEQGSVIVRSRSLAHQLTVKPGTKPMTLFLSGPRFWTWGFWCPKGFVEWSEYLKRKAGPDGSYGTGHSSVGIGCGEQ